MKSSKDELRRRGKATQKEIDSLNKATEQELVEFLHSDVATVRTSATYGLCQDKFVNELLQQLSLEKCLYTKIAICECLEKGNLDTARQMIKYLGKIGNNQHKELPNKVSLKKSYPLPRDIIARSLGRMTTAIFPVLLEVLNSNDIVKTCEVLDAIGYMVFYNSELVSEHNAKIIYEVIDKYQDTDLVLWKAILCLSAFPLPKSIKILNNFALYNNMLGEEAKRSIKLINLIKRTF